MNESKPSECIMNEAMPSFPPRRASSVMQFGPMDYSLPVTEFQLSPLIARIEKIEQWIERQEQHQAEQNEQH